MSEGQNYVTGQTYLYWQDVLRETAVKLNNKLPEGATVLDSIDIAAKIDELLLRIRELEKQNTQLIANSLDVPPPLVEAREAIRYYRLNLTFQGWPDDAPSPSLLYLIKELRAYTGLGLREAKDMAEAIAAEKHKQTSFVPVPVRDFGQFQLAMIHFGVIASGEALVAKPPEPLFKVKAPT